MRILERKMAIGSIVIVIYILLVQTTTAGSRDIQQGRKNKIKTTKIGSNIYESTNVLPDFKIVP